MQELVYPSHIQAEIRHCFLLLPVCTQGSSVSLSQHCCRSGFSCQATPDTIPGYRWIPRCWPCVLVFWRKGKQAFTAVSVGCLSPFPSAALRFLCSAGFIEVGFFAFMESLPLTSPFFQIFLVFFIFLIVWTKLNSLPKVIMDLSSSKHSLIAAYITASFSWHKCI